MPINHSKVNELSKKAIEGLKPEKVWDLFYQMSRIPRPSFKEQAVKVWLKKVADEQGWTYKEDKTGNVLLDTPATDPSLKDVAGIVIQGHIDMVTEKSQETDHDFDKDPIELVNKGDGWIWANQTTLGSDNGIGCVVGMAIAMDKTIKRGPIQLLFTIDEETGMSGALGLDTALVPKSTKYLLNLDSEDDGAFSIGCAGGADGLGVMKGKRIDVPAKQSLYKLVIGGLRGGHSGVNIHEYRGNAIKFLTRALKLLQRAEIDFSLVSAQAGSKRNAIPRDSSALIYLGESDVEKVQAILAEMVKDSEYKTVDPDLKATLTKSDVSDSPKPFEKSFTKKLLSTLYVVPSGPVKMSHDLEGLVETSNNLSVLTTEGDEVKIVTMARSSHNGALIEVNDMVRDSMELGGCDVKISGFYPGWTPNPQSKLLAKTKEVFTKLRKGEEPTIDAIHAGLENGLIMQIYPWLDSISYGPTIVDAHSPTERVKIEDVQKTYDLTVALVEELAKSE